MSDTTIISAVTFVYLAAFLFYLIRLLRGSERWGAVAAWIARAGFVLHSAALLLRWKISYDLGIGHAPLSNFYESLVFFSWSIVLVHLLIEGRSKARSLGAFLMPLAFLPLAYATISPAINDRIQPLVPALQSNWLTIHVLTCFLGYAFFAAAVALGVMLLVKERGPAVPEGPLRRQLPAAAAVEELLYHAILLGFVFLSLGIMTGSIWAHFAWGAYWSWDPKETWSLITWLVYALTLHLRAMRGWRGRRMGWLALLGFASVLFTYLGVNYLDSLHSYF